MRLLKTSPLKCATKRRYLTRAEAKKTAKFAMRKGEPHIYVYRCDNCNQWHLTKVDKNAIGNNEANRKR